MSVRCHYNLKNGSQCARIVTSKIDDKHCWQHQDGKLMKKKITYNEIPSTLTGIKELDIQILQYIDSNLLTNMRVDKYTQDILEDSNFWKNILQNKYNVDIDGGKKLDYKYVVNIADRNITTRDVPKEKSTRLERIFRYKNKLLLPTTIFDCDIYVRLNDLLALKPNTYEEFKKNINLLIVDEYVDDIIPEDPININELLYNGNMMTFKVSSYIHDTITITIYSDNGFTRGTILYKLIQIMPQSLDWYGDDEPTFQGCYKYTHGTYKLIITDY